MRWRRRRPGPAVSIVLSTHNRASLLPVALDSALAQDYPNLDVLVMDDGSTDETSEVLSGYASRLRSDRFRFERHANMGQARTLNRGYQLARGELVCFLSDDDRLAPGLVSALVRAVEERPDASAAYSAYWVIDENGSILDTWLPLQYSPTTALARHDTIVGPPSLARRSAVDACGGWDHRYKWMPDLILWMSIARSGPIVRVDEPLGAWRKHPGGAMSTTGVKRAAEHLRLFEHGLALYPAVAEDPELRAEALRNASAIAAWFGRFTEFAPGEPITMVDGDRPLISAWASGQDPTTNRFDAAHAERVASAFRTLGELTLTLADARDRDLDPDAQPGGYERAVERLRAVGALTQADGSASAVDEDAFGPALIAAALDCAADVPSERRRFLIPTRRQSAVVAEELQALASLTMAAPAMGRGILEAIRGEIARRREDLEQALDRGVGQR